jgi:hypothetical protein
LISVWDILNIDIFSFVVGVRVAHLQDNSELGLVWLVVLRALSVDFILFDDNLTSLFLWGVFLGGR